MSREKGMVPAGNLCGRLGQKNLYEDNEGNLFLTIDRSLSEVIRAAVTNGRGYDPIEYPSFVGTNEEMRLKWALLDSRRSSLWDTWSEDVREGHPEYRKALLYGVFFMGEKL